MIRICDGSREALAILFRRYARLVRTVAMRILRDDSEADDLLQDVFLFVHRNCSIFDSSRAAVRSWIVQMTYHRAIDRRRYLDSRHFYTRLDLDGVADLLDPRSAGWQDDDPFRFIGRKYDPPGTSPHPDGGPAQYSEPAFFRGLHIRRDRRQAGSIFGKYQKPLLSRLG